MKNERLIHEIRQRMEDKGIGQKKLALSAELNETYVRDILKGKSKRPDVFSIGRLAVALGCTVDELIGMPSFDHAQSGHTVSISKISSEALYTEEEEAVIELWRSLLPDQKEHLIGLLEAMMHRKIA
ncbi:helix-turn-helix domain-containing protein [Saccharibacter sp. 17.LH.SD]|nr:helix-turn-helix transcriptional regulator [Saccharibacter sp. 17.LH.SD]MXV44352.1 helix-turn-helix domain-containing protein [Saccharibacter sp. 17.LH.SD]